MLGAASRTALRRAAPRQALRNTPPRRFIGITPPAHRSRSWRNGLARWGLAIGAVYFYNTSPIFAEEPSIQPPRQEAIPTTTQEDENLLTVESVSAARKQHLSTNNPPVSSSVTAANPTPGQSSGSPEDADAASAGPQQLEEEAESQGAFNEETGEINWDCPCLGGMAYGPCGEQFREAFSCFVYSNEEPKGINCIDRFKHMQDCFRAHPDVYGAELTDDADEEADEPTPGSGSGVEPANAPYSGEKTPADKAPASAQTATPSSSPSSLSGQPQERAPAPSEVEHQVAAKKQRVRQASEQVSSEHGLAAEEEEVVPRAWHNTTSANSKSEK